MTKIRKYIITFLIIGFILSFIFEYLHIPLYRLPTRLPHLVISLLSTILDLMFILFIYFCMTKVYKDNTWAMNWSTQKTLIIVISALIWTAVGEKIAISLGLWSYSSAMPIVPILGVGFTPLLIMGIVPLATLYISSKI